jgi:hypothetical protein
MFNRLSFGWKSNCWKKRVWARDFINQQSLKTYPKTLISGCLMAINLFLKKLKGITDPEKNEK